MKQFIYSMWLLAVAEDAVRVYGGGGGGGLATFSFSHMPRAIYGFSISLQFMARGR